MSKYMREMIDKVRNFNQLVKESNGETIVYHASPNKFDRFDLNKIGDTTDNGWFGWGMYFFEKKEDALDFSIRFNESNIYEVIVKLGKNLNLTDSSIPNDVKEVLHENNIIVDDIWGVQSFCLENDYNPKIITKILIGLGYDSLRLGMMDSVEIIIFNDENIVKIV